MAINKWKVTAIIFITLFLLETSLIMYSYNIGKTSIDNNLKCSNEICFNVNAEAFVYDDTTQVCQCYIGEEIIKREIMK